MLFYQLRVQQSQLYIYFCICLYVIRKVVFRLSVAHEIENDKSY